MTSKLQWACPHQLIFGPNFVEKNGSDCEAKVCNARIKQHAYQTLD